MLCAFTVKTRFTVEKRFRFERGSNPGPLDQQTSVFTHLTTGAPLLILSFSKDKSTYQLRDVRYYLFFILVERKIPIFRCN